MENTVLSPPAEAPSVLPALADEGERLRALEAYQLDSLEDDAELTAITTFVARLCETPIALVSLTEEGQQRFLAHHGIDVRGVPRSGSFCAQAMLLDTVLEITDAQSDAALANHPLVVGGPRIRFYAGQPLFSEEGLPLGALCVIDPVPRPGGLTAFQRG